jgi:uncharacterized protein YndB with AHSA1/START domain
MTITDPQPHEFTLSWTLDAPPADVFRAWTDPDQLDWFYNDEFPAPAEPIELDLRVGGVWRQQMIVDETTAYPTGGVYREIVPNERLAFSWGAVGGWPALDPDRPEDSPLVTVTLSQEGGRTEMTVQVQLPASFEPKGQPAGWFDHIRQGMSDTVDRLVAALETAPTGRPT